KSKEISPEIVLVRMSFKNWEKYQKAKAGKNQNLEGDLAFQLPDGVDLGAWRQFAKDADREELLAVIWSKILKLSDEVIAAGIHVTPGTVRHRVGRGLRLLGELKMY
ncbi:MAG: hypothetical protein KDD61_01420, partial [Bdellovibrionales bacterium]|nr:hypothetical protein [Bdellovibrionales bacterium]